MPTLFFTLILFLAFIFNNNILWSQQSRDSSTLATVLVSGKKEQKTKQVLMGVEKINAQLVNKLPFFFGERDMMAVTKLMPGVKSASGGQGSLSIRGGGYDQNLVLLDGTPVYNPSHLLGAFSVFHSDAIQDITLYKGTAPARYGGRTSGVIEAKSREGDNERYIAKGGLGIITSRLSVEGPIQKGKSSFFLSGRRTYADLLARTFSKRFEGNKLYFYDGNAHINFHLNAKNTLSLTGYYGADQLVLQNLFGVRWSNIVGAIHYQYKLSENSSFNTHFSFNQYKANLQLNRTDADNKPLVIEFLSRINEFNFNEEWLHNSTYHKLQIGISALHRNNAPGNIFLDGVALLPFNRSMLELGFYAQDHWQILPNLKVQYGLRLQSYLILGDKSNANLKAKAIEKQYFSPEPRLALNYSFLPNHSLKVAYNRNSQGVFLISNSVASLPTDRWTTASRNIPVSLSDIGSIGYVANIKGWEFSAEVYYKSLNNIADYKDGANDNDPMIDQQLLTGKGRAYGLELLIRKQRGIFSGWIAYTLARTEQNIPGINNNQWYHARQDRRHDFNIVFITKPHPKLTLALLWTYQTGNAISIPSAKYQLMGRTTFFYDGRNTGRMPPMHHLDFSLAYKLKTYKHLSSELSFSIFNVYARENPFIIRLKEDPNQANKIDIVQIALFSIIPSISWNFTIF